MIVAGEFDFKQRLREMREMRGLTQEQLGNRIGESANTISNWEMPSGRSLPNLRKFRLICIALNCSPDYFLGLSTAELSEWEMQYVKRLRNLDADGLYAMDATLEIQEKLHARSDG